MTSHLVTWELSLGRFERARAVEVDPVRAAWLDGAIRAYREALYREHVLVSPPRSEADVWLWEGLIEAQRLLVLQAAR